MRSAGALLWHTCHAASIVPVQQLSSSPSQRLVPWLQSSNCSNRCPGLGALSVLDDTLVLAVLGLLPGRDLAAAAAASKSLYCFANHEPLWKALAVEVRT